MLPFNKKQKIIDFLHREIPKLTWLGLFGSAVTSKFNAATSDVDIAFVTSLTITNVQRWEIQEKLASELNLDVDLVDLKQSNTVLAYEILTMGEVVFEKKSKDLDSFLDAVYINYLQLNEDRKEIMEMYA